MPLPARLLFALPLAALVSSCQGQRELIVSDAVIRLSPVLNNPAAMYFKVKGGPVPTTLVAVLVPSALRAEMHGSSRGAGGMMAMTPLESVPIPADAVTEFKPGGYHVMLWGVNLVARRLKEADVTFVFGTGERILVTAAVEQIGGGDPILPAPVPANQPPAAHPVHDGM